MGIEDAKEGVALIGEIIKVAGNDPKVKEAGSNLGTTAVTITKAINNALLPLAAVNFAFDKAKQYFNNHFSQDIAEKTANIPPENLIEPKPSIAGPALQGLAFSHEEANLKEMYLGLLASSMDNRIAENAHPAFVEVIKQLDSEEAKLLQQILKLEGSVPIAEIRATALKSREFTVLARHVMPLLDPKTNEHKANPHQAAMVDNWIRLGLVSVSYAVQLTSSYDWVTSRPEYLELEKKVDTKLNKIDHASGVIERSDFGIQFGKAVGLIEN